jgi:hypothetical protein
MVDLPPSPALVGGLRGSQPAASRHGGKGRGSLLPSIFVHKVQRSDVNTSWNLVAS